VIVKCFDYVWPTWLLLLSLQSRDGAQLSASACGPSHPTALDGQREDLFLSLPFLG
jgi:hypothetical protein